MASNVGTHMMALVKANRSLKKENDSLKLRVDELEKQISSAGANGANSQGVSSELAQEG